MKTIATVLAPAVPLARFADYLELTKPRVQVLVLFTVVAGALLAPGHRFDPLILLHALLGTACVAAGASALNQLLERRTDARMHRTEFRPLPTGRLHPSEVLAFGLCAGVGGVSYLAVALPHPYAAIVAAATFVSYAFIYTPLKRRTTLNTLVGAVPGALPPVIGWAAMAGPDAFTGPDLLRVSALFLILFVWQLPHFLAIAWIYKTDYRRAGLRMVPVLDDSGLRTGWRMVGYCVALIPICLAPVALGVTGPIYFLGALGLGVGFLLSSIAFLRSRSVAQARRVLRSSLLFLPALLALLLIDALSTPLVLALWP